MKFADQLNRLEACEAAERVGDRTLADCWSTWSRPTDMAWLVRRVCSSAVWVPMLASLGPLADPCARQSANAADGLVGANWAAYAVMGVVYEQSAIADVIASAACGMIRECVTVEALEKAIIETIEREEHGPA